MRILGLGYISQPSLQFSMVMCLGSSQWAVGVGDVYPCQVWHTNLPCKFFRAVHPVQLPEIEVTFRVTLEAMC